jgi:hypothetical protein
MKALSFYVSYPHFDYDNDYVKLMTLWRHLDVIKYYFRYYFEQRVMMSNYVITVYVNF